MWNKTSIRVQNLKPSAIRKYFAVPDDVVTLGIGEPDFTTPDRLMAAAHKALDRGNTHYTANAGLPAMAADFFVENLKRSGSENFYKIW